MFRLQFPVSSNVTEMQIRHPVNICKVKATGKVILVLQLLIYKVEDLIDLSDRDVDFFLVRFGRPDVLHRTRYANDASRDEDLGH